ncbi:Zinc_finger domain-containing protein [Hexamita inflata]|uniref:Zinc finger domain-containing protein n=1 Tax=Hexamita inflata TaxID=28002 RepID=A0AA86R5U9_9EUKA|nr:Zinc finger domain-containing protein [Hexamita inflata]CAI9966753.1 Zinc finger domain-containing protein [Hexamita inflata]
MKEYAAQCTKCKQCVPITNRDVHECDEIFCLICQGIISTNFNFITLPCNYKHKMHEVCYQKYQEISCPLCRKCIMETSDKRRHQCRIIKNLLKPHTIRFPYPEVQLITVKCRDCLRIQINCELVVCRTCWLENIDEVSEITVSKKQLVKFLDGQESQIELTKETGEMRDDLMKTYKEVTKASQKAEPTKNIEEKAPDKTKPKDAPKQKEEKPPVQKSQDQKTTQKPQPNTKSPQKETQKKKEDKQPVLEKPVKSQPKDGPNEQKTIADAKQETMPILTNAQKKKQVKEYQKQLIQQQRAKEDIKATKPQEIVNLPPAIYSEIRDLQKQINQEGPQVPNQVDETMHQRQPPPSNANTTEQPLVQAEGNNEQKGTEREPVSKKQVSESGETGPLTTQ